VTMSESCSFIEYINDVRKKSHVGLGVDAKEAENEICGVILGSLDSAKSGKALTREEYIQSVRSYIQKDTVTGGRKRHDIYSVYEGYKNWKQEHNRFDLNDIVLKLINALKDIRLQNNDDRDNTHKRGWIQLFNAMYLDEVQDFSYASIYLICNIAGCQTLHWVFAGDTAQMISPGCSFTFSGLKEVLLAVQPDIERKIKHVNKLAKNYRVTKDVLALSNSVLHVAKKYFRNDIQYLRPEIAMKDVGTRVRICQWKEALNLEKRPRFGPNQALIYSSTSNSDGVALDMNDWLNEHPFIMTSLDAKGLEFDDCVVAFDEEQKAWNINSDRAASLRLLRELYVAITRAKRRVVVLINSPKMRDFFMSLPNCNIEESDAKVALLEFDSTTTRDEWLKRGKQLFDDEQYKMAASCFKAAEHFGYFEWAQGKYEMLQGPKELAKESFRRSARRFFEDSDYKHTLDLLSLVIENPPWNSSDDDMYDVCRQQIPSYFTPEKSVGFALNRNKWAEINTHDLKNASLAHLFRPLRTNPELRQLITTCSQSDLLDIEYSLPLSIGDYYIDRNDYLNAARLYLQQSDYSEQDPNMAEKATNLLIQSMITPSNSKIKSSSLDTIAKCWKQSRGTQASRILAVDSDAALLLQLYENPIQVAKSRRSSDALKKFGRDVITSAFAVSNELEEELHRFSSDQFEAQVDRALSKKFKGNLIEAVQWYLHRNDKAHAEQLAGKNIKYWSKHDLLEIVRHKLNVTGLIQEADNKHCLTDLVKVCLSSEVFNLKRALEISERALSSITKAEANYKDLIEAWDKHKNDSRVNKLLVQEQATSVFLNLFWKPKISSNRLSGRCIELFGLQIVEFAVSRAIDNPTEQFDTLFNFDKEAFEHLRPLVKFKNGDRVTVHGLQKAPTLNGKSGTILRWVQDKGRYEVRIDRRKKSILISPSNIKINGGFNQDTDDSEDENVAFHNDQTRAQSIQNSRVMNTNSSDDDSDQPPALNARDQSTSESSSGSDDSIPSLQERGKRSNSSDSSDDISSSSSVPNLTRKDNSSSDEEDNIPALIGPNNQSSSSSDESVPRRMIRGPRPTGNSAGRGDERARGRGAARGRGGAKGKQRQK